MAEDTMDPLIDIAFDCQPLRLIGRRDVPLDATPAQHSRLERMQAALSQYGVERTYYLFDAHCVFRFANSEIFGMARFAFEGTVQTDLQDARTQTVDLIIELQAETCGGITEGVLAWFKKIIHETVRIEFDRYISSGSFRSHLPQSDSPDSFGGGHL